MAALAPGPLKRRVQSLFGESSASGHASPAAAARFRLSWIVERATPRRRPISRVASPAENFSRIISRASRIPIRSAGIDPPLGLPKGRPDQANGAARQSEKDPGRDHSVWGARSSRIRGRHHSVTRGGIIPELGGGFLRKSGRVTRGRRRAGSGVTEGDLT